MDVYYNQKPAVTKIQETRRERRVFMYVYNCMSHVLYAIFRSKFTAWGSRFWVPTDA